MQAVALSSRKGGYLFVLVTTREVKAAQVGTGVHLATAHENEVLSVGEVFPNTLFGVYILMGLIHIGDFYGISYEELPTIGLFFPHNHTEDSGFPCTIGAYYPYDTRLWEDKVQVIIEELITESLAYMARLYHIGTQARPIRDIDFELFFQLFLVFTQ